MEQAQRKPPNTLGGAAVSSWSLGSKPDQGWLVNGGKYYSPSVWMQSPVEPAPYRWCGSPPEQVGCPLSPAVSSQDGPATPSWKQPCLVTDPLLCCCCPHRAGLPTIPIGKTAGSWASTGWEKFLLGWGPPCSSPALSSTVVAINNQGYG